MFRKSWDDVDSHCSGLVYNRPAETLKTFPLMPWLVNFNFGDLVNVLEADGAGNLMSWVGCGFSRALLLSRWAICRDFEKMRCLGRADIKGEGPVTLYPYSAGHWCSSDDVRRPRVELLFEWSTMLFL